MSATNDGGPAFRAAGVSFVNTPQNDIPLRDWFAGMALSGILNNSNAFANMSDKDVAENCYRAADAMLAARNSKPTETEQEGQAANYPTPNGFVIVENIENFDITLNWLEDCAYLPFGENQWHMGGWGGQTALNAVRIGSDIAKANGIL